MGMLSTIKIKMQNFNFIEKKYMGTTKSQNIITTTLF